MRTSLHIGRILGIPIKVSLSVLGIAGLVVYTIAFRILPTISPEASLKARVGVALASALLFFVSILVHELGHAVLARRHEIEVSGITIWLLGGVAKLSRQAETPRAEFQIAIAGPFASLVTGLFFGLCAFALASLSDWRLLPIVLAWLAFVNGLLAFSNLLPAAPLDGGRVLTAFLWKRLGDAERARLISARCGLILGATLMILAGFALLFYDRVDFNILSIAAMGVFLLGAARGEILAAAVRGRLNITLVDSLMARHPTPLLDSTTVEQLLLATAPGHQTSAVPVIRWGTEPVGYVLPAQLVAVAAHARSWTELSQVMVPAESVPRAWSTEPLDSLMSRIDLAANPIVVVHDPHSGRELGTISEPQIHRALVRPNLWGSLPPIDDSPDQPARPPLVPSRH